MVQDPERRVGEPDRPSDFRRCRWASSAACPPLAGQHGHAAVVFGAGHAAAGVFAGQQAAWRSRVLPLAKLDGRRNSATVPVASSHLMIRLLGMSLHNR